MTDIIINDNRQQSTIMYLELLDLRHVKSIDELIHISEISYVSTILISEQLEGSIHNIPMNYVGSIVRVPTDAKMKIITGDLRVQGSFFEQADPDEILLTTGELTVTTAFTNVAYSSVIITGNVFVPRSCESLLTPKISQIYGELYFYEEDIKVLSGQERLGYDFFYYLKRPITLFLRGEYIIEPEVTLELLDSRILQIYLFGHLQTANQQQASLLLSRTAHKQGNIQATHA